MRVLVTRPQAQALATAEALRRRGHEPLVDPVLVIEPVTLAPIEPARFAALLLTSANAAPALTPEMRMLPVFCVGTATARAAEAAGCHVAGIGEDDGRALAGLVAAQLPVGARLLHLAGADSATGLAEALAERGLAAERHVAYRAVPAATLAAATRSALAGSCLDAVLFYSPRSARLWCGLVAGAGLAATTPRLIAACLSAAVASAAGTLRWRRVVVAARRDETALLDRLDAPG